MTVTSAGQQISRAVAQALDRRSVWVSGEVHEIYEPDDGGYMGVQLVTETEKGGAHAIGAFIGPKQLTRITRYLDTLDLTVPDVLAVGNHVAVEGELGIWVPKDDQNGMVRGQISVSKVAPETTLGWLEQRRTESIAALVEAGALMDAGDGNHRPPVDKGLPAHIRSVAVVTTPSSDARHDVEYVLRSEAADIACRLVPVDRLEGARASGEIAASIRSVTDSDVILLVRGGGDQAGLGVFDHLDIGLAIHESPIPVIAGLGHEADRPMVAEMVAARREPVPNAAARAVIDCNRTAHGKVGAGRDACGQRSAERRAEIAELRQHRRTRSQLVAAVVAIAVAVAASIATTPVVGLPVACVVFGIGAMVSRRRQSKDDTAGLAAVHETLSSMVEPTSFDAVLAGFEELWQMYGSAVAVPETDLIDARADSFANVGKNLIWHPNTSRSGPPSALAPAQPIRAKRSSTCFHCQRQVHINDPIVKSGSSWVHVGCSEVPSR